MNTQTLALKPSLLSSSLVFLIMIFIWSANVKQANAVDFQVSDAEKFIEQIIKDPQEESRFYVVFMMTSWCGHCKRSLPYLFDIKKRYGNKVKIMLLLLDDNEMAASQLAKSVNGPVDIVAYYPESQLDLDKIFSYFNIVYQNKIPCILFLRRDSRRPLLHPYIGLQSVDNYLSNALK